MENFNKSWQHALVVISLMVMIPYQVSCKSSKAPSETAPASTSATPSTPTPGSEQPAATAVAGKEHVLLETTMGNIEIEFFPDVAPKHVENFLKLTKQGFYNKTTFHRVIPGFMIQGGDPNSKDDDRTNDGRGGPGYSIPAEFNNKPHKRGTMSMARSGDPNSGGSQFFICVADAPHLDFKYTVFGQVVSGLEVVDKIVASSRDNRDNPLEKVVVTKATVK